MRFRPILLLLILITSGCSSQKGSAKLFERAYPAAEISGVQIVLEKGQINLEGSGGDQILINASSGSAFDPAFSLDGGTLLVHFEGSLPSDRIKINLPPGLTLEIQAFDGDMELESIQGNLTLRNTAGDIILEDFHGEARMWAGRGDISVRGGEGEVIVLGEHGNLTVADFSGAATMTTIMGKIEYIGVVESYGDILLEADHGPINAILPEKSDYQIEINSASGEIICQGGNLGRTITGCAGSTGNGTGTLKIRTVSGRIEFQILPDKAQ